MCFSPSHLSEIAGDMAREAPYGTWESPLTTGLLAGKTISLDEVKVNV